MPFAQYVVSLGIDGRIAAQGTVSETLATNEELRKEALESEMAEKKAEEVEAIEGKDEKKGQDNSGKLVMAEEVVEGHVGWNSSAYCMIDEYFEPLTNYFQSNSTFSTWEVYHFGCASLAVFCCAICST